MQKVRFGDVAERINIHVDQQNTDLEYYIGGEHIESCEFMIHSKAPIKGATIGYQFQFGFEPNDILFMTKNPHLRKASMVDFRGLCSIATFVIRTKDKSQLLQEYLLLEMQSDRFWQYLEENKSGGVNYFINWGTLSNYMFELPDMSKQKELSKKVWSAYRVKEAYKKLLVATDEMVKSQFIEMIGSKNWPEAKLKDIVHEDCSISYGIVQPGDDIEDGVPIVRPVDMNDTHLIERESLKKTSREISDAYSRTILRGDEILICVRGTTGLISKAEGLQGCNVTRGITPLFFKPEYNKEYLYRAFLGEKVQTYIKDNTIGSTLKGINMGTLREMPVCIPTCDIQQKFVCIAEQADKSKYIN